MGRRCRFRRAAGGPRRRGVHAEQHRPAAYSALGEKQKALDDFGQALPLQARRGDRAGEAATLTTSARSTAISGRSRRRLTTLGRRCRFGAPLGDRAGEASTLSNIGVVYADLGQKQKTLELQ